MGHDAFFIDRYEITNAAFRRFVTETGYRTTAESVGRAYSWIPKNDRWQWATIEGASWKAPNGSAEPAPAPHPVVQVSWHDAHAYRKWAGKRLPFEAEWEKAARGTNERPYPWDHEWDARLGDIAWKTTRSIGANPEAVSLYGIHDMAVNVWE